MRQSPEHNSQVALFHWAFLERRKYPELELMFAVPNGGQRNKIVAAKLKAEGVKAGVPDIMLPVARGKYHGMALEMKAAKGRISDEQKYWHERLAVQGYYVAVCYSFDAARIELENYLKG